jgi:CheY-like chemotaxis protein
VADYKIITQEILNTKLTRTEPAKILIAEDEKDILAQYRLALEGRDHLVVTTATAECLDACMAEIQKHVHPFDAVVLDHHMPKMTRMEVAKHILAANPRQWIIFASAYINKALVESIKQLKQIVELL